MSVTTAMKTDAQIQGDVLKELDWDPRVEETEVGVSGQHGVVTLSGTVTSWAKRMAAQEAAHRVTGVLDVANDIVVKVPGGLGRSDTEIAAADHTLAFKAIAADVRMAALRARAAQLRRAAGRLASAREN